MLRVVTNELRIGLRTAGRDRRRFFARSPFLCRGRRLRRPAAFTRAPLIQTYDCANRAVPDYST
jgi:hypothetical protein